MSEQLELSEDTSEPSDSPPTAASMPQPLNSSGKPSGTPFQDQVTNAVTGSEFVDTWEAGIPIRRRGPALNIPYDQAMEYLWPSNQENY